MGVRAIENAAGYPGWSVFVNHQGRRKFQACGTGRSAGKDARALAEQWRSLITLGRADEVFAKAVPHHAPSTYPKLKDAVEAWIERQRAAGEIRGATPTAYLGRLGRWCFAHALPDGRLLGDLPVDQITREHLGAVVHAIKAAGRGKATVEHVRMPLKGFYREQVELKVLPANPAADLGFFVGKMKRGKRVDYFSAAECDQVLRAAQGTRGSGFVAAALGTGARWGELAALTRDDVVDGRLHVRASWSPKARAVQPPRNGKGRYVPMAPELVELIQAQIETREAEGWGALALVFPAENGGHLHDGHFATAWRALLKRAGVPYRPFHSCRHTFASHALKAGVRPELVQQWLGHGTLSQTLDTYRHFIPDHAADAADAAKLGVILRGA
jgi:integrase